MKSGLVFVVDDEEIMRQSAEQSLKLAGLSVQCFSNASDALKHITPDWPGIVVTDMRMPDTDGLIFMDELLQLDSESQVVLISGHADIATAVKAIQQGAYDFIEKPFSASRLVEVASRALDKRALILDNRELRAELQKQAPEVKLLGRSACIRELNQTLAHIGSTDADVLILGETGTGKELVATSLHQFSKRKAKRFVAINCGALPDSLIESELFGHVRGAFTGAEKDQMGKLEYTNSGTFFLDEIESMPLNMQVKLLRVLQERKIQRVGSHADFNLDIRIVAATKIDLLEASRRGDFREDLYYRLNVVKVRIPPLRERKEDIPILFQHFYDQACKRMDKESEYPDSTLMSQLMEHDWPGNVRELQHAAERTAIGLADGQFDSMKASNNSDALLLSLRVDAYEKLTIEQELVQHAGNITETYKSLGVSRKTLYDKMKKHGLSKKDFQNAQVAQARNG